MAADRSLVAELRNGLAAAGDPERAAAMKAYMKSAMPFHGVPAPAARRIYRDVFRTHPLPDRATWLATVELLWTGATHREERYGAIALARHRLYRGHQSADLLPVYADLVRTGAWWDLVDDIASHLVGPVMLADPAAARPVVERWAADEDRWLRRTAIICQLGAKTETDVGLLTHAIDRNLDDGDFFIRKAIGWALRQHARTDPDWVQAFVAARGDRLSPLSRREALKHVSAG